MTAPQFDQYGFGIPAKAPRPQARTGAALVMGGAVLHILGVFMPWYNGTNGTLRGLDDYTTADGDPLHAPGVVWIVVGVILFGLGVATYVARRHLAVAVVATCVCTIGLFTSLLGVGAAKATADRTGVGEPAFGAYLGIVSILVAFAGSVQVLAKRRR